ncbi:MAG: aminotransferase class V-fold PLP-dependent enzyme [Gemmatimonadetes bacterium]|nr:aminotransferase class V-fold PLP-dependent enzyme [Gemmatimonadota bacterium]MDA1102180.1 aminotransferase class V-fold PLP-dependent enzyme [Gemmatimonadota bacterium]
MTEALRCQRDQFQLPRDYHYFNCAYMGPLPRISEEAGFEAIRQKRTPTSIAAPDAFWGTDGLRDRFARLVNVRDSGRIAIQPGVSYGVATAARNLPVDSSQNIVITHEQFPGNVYSWRRLAAESGAELRTVVPPEGANRGQGWNERLLESIDMHTAIVAVPNIHWTDGTYFDLIAVGRRCREVGAALVVDATQSVGALPFDVEQVQPDVLICATYKWLLGPYALSFAYFGPRFDDGVPLEETWIARDGSRDFQRLVDYQDQYLPGAVRYDVSERSSFFLAPIAAASLDLLLDWQPSRIQEYCHVLTRGFLSQVGELGYSVEVEEWRSSHLFGLRMPPSVDLEVLKDSLAQRNVSASLRGTALRLSANVYNDQVDVAVLLEVLQGAVK